MNTSNTPIFLITTHSSEKKIVKVSETESYESPARCRSWGFYHTLEEAEEAVFNNHTSLDECGYYDMVTIEEISPGIISGRGKIFFFTWDENIIPCSIEAGILIKETGERPGGWVMCDRPRWAEKLYSVSKIG